MEEKEDTKKVLVLDDDQVVLNTCRDILEETDLEVVTTTSVEECFDIANVGDIDLFT